MNRFTYIFLLMLVLGLWGCSQQKNTIVNRTYHNTTARYNGFFNGRLALQEAYGSMAANYKEDYSLQLPIFISDKEEVVQPTFPQLERAIEKTSMVVDRHSMDISGKEYCKWIDDTWLVMGEAQFLKREYVQAKQIFDFTKRKYEDVETRQLSLFWLGRLYMEQEEYDKAGDHLRKVGPENGLPEKHLGNYYAVMAEFYLRQSKVDKAIENLERSIGYTKKRAEKTRRLFILAQLYDRIGEGAQSSQLFAEVIRRNPAYEMAFYAKINRALSYDVSAGNSEEIKEILQKMVRDEKNKEFLDEVYYALAELELKEGDEPKGIEYLNLATSSSVRNGNAKGLAYYRLAEIYFAKPQYAQAQVYYDSTVSFLNAEHPDYEMILARANSLTQMMRDLTIIETEDSLQAFALLPEKEQEKLIEQKIEDVIQAEKDEERRKQLEELQGQQSKFDQGNQFNQNMKSGDWYFYNPGAVGFGAGEFKKIWGANRKNEDNWRRADRTSSAPLLIAEEGAVLEGDTIEGANDPKNPNYYRKSIPDTEEKMARSHALIIEALYDLALVYKDQMHDLPPSAETFEELLSRYDSSKYHVSSHYQLYLMYQEMGNQAKSEYHKSMVLNNYSESDYAKVIVNPNYAQEASQNTEAVEGVYQQAYVYFDQGYYRQAYTMTVDALEKFPNSDYEPQMKFLCALCLGYIENEARMIAELETVKSAYSGSDVGKEAEEILQYFKNGKSFEAELAEEKLKNEAEMIEKAVAAYTYDIGASHNFVLVVPDTANPQAIQTRLSDFNRTFFSTKGFKTSSIPIKDNRTMVIVSNVGFAAKAMEYYQTLMGSPQGVGMKTTTKVPFVISYDNYAVFYKDPNTEAYLQFFTDNYLKSK